MLMQEGNPYLLFYVDVIASMAEGAVLEGLVDDLRTSTGAW